MLHKEKRLIKNRLHRLGKAGQQISNGYQLDLTRFYPPDEGERIGKQLWSQVWKMIQDYGDRHGGPAKAAEIHAQNSHAYYTLEGKLLTVYLNSRNAVPFFETHHRDEYAGALYTLNPGVARIEFIVPPGNL